MRQIIIWRNRFRKFIDYPPAVIPFLKKYLYYNWVADSYLKYYQDVKFLNYKETIDLLITEDKSFARFGDEVFDMIQGIGLYFNDWHQKYDPELAERLKEVLRSSHPKLLVGFNPELIFLSKAKFNEMGISHEYQYWVNSKIFMKDYIHSDQIYGRALCFHERYNPTIDYKQITEFLAQKHLIVVTSNTQRFGGRTFGKTTDYIEGPYSNAWENYDQLRIQVEMIAKQYDQKEVLVLCSLGPTSKIMAYDLTQEGYTVWDTGQFFDLALEQIK